MQMVSIDEGTASGSGKTGVSRKPEEICTLCHIQRVARAFSVRMRVRYCTGGIAVTTTSVWHATQLARQRAACCAAPHSMYTNSSNVDTPLETRCKAGRAALARMFRSCARWPGAKTCISNELCSGFYNHSAVGSSKPRTQLRPVASTERLTIWVKTLEFHPYKRRSVYER